MVLILFLLFASELHGLSFSSLASNLLGFHEGDACNFTRVDSLVCLIEYVDISRNGQIEQDEFEFCKRNYLPGRMTALVWLARKVNYDIPFKQILRDCDANHDGILTAWDWLHSAKTCLPTQDQMCKLKTICDIARQKST